MVLISTETRATFPAINSTFGVTLELLGLKSPKLVLFPSVDFPSKLIVNLSSFVSYLITNELP